MHYWAWLYSNKALAAMAPRRQALIAKCRANIAKIDLVNNKESKRCPRQHGNEIFSNSYAEKSGMGEAWPTKGSGRSFWTVENCYF
jgi:hypothetical protein